MSSKKVIRDLNKLILQATIVLEKVEPYRAGTLVEEIIKDSISIPNFQVEKAVVSYIDRFYDARPEFITKYDRENDVMKNIFQISRSELLADLLKDLITICEGDLAVAYRLRVWLDLYISSLRVWLDLYISSLFVQRINVFIKDWPACMKFYVRVSTTDLDNLRFFKDNLSKDVFFKDSLFKDVFTEENKS